MSGILKKSCCPCEHEKTDTRKIQNWISHVFQRKKDPHKTKSIEVLTAVQPTLCILQVHGLMTQGV